MRYRLHKLLFKPVGSTQIETLDRGPTKFDADLQVGFLKGDITFTRLTEAVLVHGNVDTEVTVQCVRSLEDFSLCLSVPLEDILFALPSLPTDEPDRQISDEGWIDLTETLREEIIMAIPINPINPKYADAAMAGEKAELSSDDSEWLTVKWNSPSPNTNSAKDA